ncbi:MAG: hypothetical protein QW698_04685 [Nitrososphaerales archaeon]
MKIALKASSLPALVYVQRLEISRKPYKNNSLYEYTGGYHPAIMLFNESKKKLVENPKSIEKCL